MKMILIGLFLLFVCQSAFTQSVLSILKANSTKVVIKDGWEGKTRYWNHLVKSQSPIVYHLAKNSTKRQVTFYTDIDSLSLQVEAESDYPLKVLLNTSDTCNVILTTKNHQYTRISKNKNKVDTIPFILNKNKQIIIKGSINGSPKIDFCFDLGARMVTVIGKDFDKTNKLILDGMMEDESVTGLSTEKTSSNNSLELGNLSVPGIPICYIDESGFLENGGALVGFNVFQSNVLEIDFDNKMLLIHKTLPEKANTFTPIELKQTTGGLYIPITINNGKKESKGWYFFDTGADNNLAFDIRYFKKERLDNSMKVIGKAGIASSESRVIDAVILEVPKLLIANYELENVPTLLADESNAESEFEDGVIGIGLQSRFNFIIDYPNGKLYLKPNTYFSEPLVEKKKDIMTSPLIGISILIGLSVIVFLGYRMIYQKRKLTT
jgi:hypothetical protein